MQDGRRVMGSAASAIATKLQTRADLVWEVPEGWSLAEAATVPTAYMTAYYSLVMRGRLSRGMRVLIHAGTGAVGLAAIQLCLQRGAEVGAHTASAPHGAPHALLPCTLQRLSVFLEQLDLACSVANLDREQCCAT